MALHCENVMPLLLAGGRQGIGARSPTGLCNADGVTHRDSVLSKHCYALKEGILPCRMVSAYAVHMRLGILSFDSFAIWSKVTAIQPEMLLPG